MLGNLFKAAVGIAIETPIAIAADALTLGGTLTDKREPYTATALKKVVQNVQETTEDK